MSHIFHRSAPLALVLGLGGAGIAAAAPASDRPVRAEAPRDGRCPLSIRYRTSPPTDRPLAQLHAKGDGFREEAVHEELRPQVDGLRQVLLRKVGAALAPLLHPSFKGTRLSPAAEDLLKKSAGLEIYRGRG